MDEISPVTAKDVDNLKKSEAGGKGLLRMANNAVAASPRSNPLASPVTTGRSKKRTRLSADSSNQDVASSKRRSIDKQVVLTEEQKGVLQVIILLF